EVDEAVEREEGAAGSGAERKRPHVADHEAQVRIQPLGDPHGLLREIEADDAGPEGRHEAADVARTAADLEHRLLARTARGEGLEPIAVERLAVQLVEE